MALEQDVQFRFAVGGQKDDDDSPFVNLADDERLTLLAVCVALQQAAGFKEYLDLRETYCVDCTAPGFNTGWGVWRFTCGAETHTDGELATPCGMLEAAMEDTGNG